MLELTIFDSCIVLSDLFWNYYKIKNVRDLFIFKYQCFFPPHLILIHNMQECCLKWADMNILFLQPFWFAMIFFSGCIQQTILTFRASWLHLHQSEKEKCVQY